MKREEHTGRGRTRHYRASGAIRRLGYTNVKRYAAAAAAAATAMRRHHQSRRRRSYY